MTTISELGDLFDDHPSLDASLADFEPGSSEPAHSPRFPPLHRNNQRHLFPSQHSGFREPSDSEEDPLRPDSSGGYSPPAWRRTGGARSSGFWNRRDNVLGFGRGSREASPEMWESAEEGDATLAAAARVRLPTGSLSPEKRRSPSPDPFPSGADFGRAFGGVKKEEERGVVPLASIPENPNNCKSLCFVCAGNDGRFVLTGLAQISASRSAQRCSIGRNRSRMRWRWS
jgi:hypothetical protein